MSLRQTDKMKEYYAKLLNSSNFHMNKKVKKYI